MSYDTSLVKSYFDLKASSWNVNNSFKEEILDLLFNKGSLVTDKTILDVGCGTGVLFNYFAKHNAKSITGIDISKRMIEIAKNNFPEINLINDDIVSYKCLNKYDLVVIYNTLPHILDLNLLLKNLKNLLNDDGKIIIAFGQSREKINQIHDNVPKGISFDLPEINDLCNIVSKYFKISYFISNDNIYEIICLNKD